MEQVWYLLAGMFTFNSLPHLISGVMGNKHMTPLAKDSSAVVNVVWGFINLVVGVYLLSLATGGLGLVPPQSGLVAYLLGGFVLSLIWAELYLSF